MQAQPKFREVILLRAKQPNYFYAAKSRTLALEPDTEELDWRDGVVRSSTPPVGVTSRGRDTEEVRWS